jgi:pimeloyl-ACP methyl ester carboxylesterase
MADLPHDANGARAGAAALEHFTVVRDDAALHVVRSRPWDATERRAPIVFFHGYPDTWEMWTTLMDALAPTHPVAAFDQRGVGGSTGPSGRDGYAFDRYLEDLEAIIDGLVGPEGQVHLVAHDWGGALSWMFAEQPRYARRLRSLTQIAGPHPALMLRRLGRALLRPSARELGFFADQVRKSWYIFFFQLPRVPEWYIQRGFPEVWLKAMRAGGVPADDPMLRDALADLEGLRKAGLTPLALYRQALGRRPPPLLPVHVPTCAIVPTRDFALRPEIYDALPEVVPDLEVHRLDANHWAHRERPAEVAAIVEAFVRRH